MEDYDLVRGVDVWINTPRRPWEASGTSGKVEYRPQPWDIGKLRFAVREPFPSRASGASLVFGDITSKQPLVLSSHMPENGVIFSDGIEGG